MRLQTIVAYLDEQYPASTAEDWDNVGLLVGDLSATVLNALTCLTLTPTVCQEAVENKVDLIVSHHPFPFRPFQRITSETIEGRLLLKLIRNGIAVYSPHTAHDSAPDGVNQQLADLFGLVDLEPLNPNGSGRIGNLPLPLKLSVLLSLAEGQLGRCSFVGQSDRMIHRVAIGCGAADNFVPAASDAGAELLLVGEARFHACLQADSFGLAMILPGHFASEHFAVVTLAEKIAAKFPTLRCFASHTERDVLQVTKSDVTASAELDKMAFAKYTTTRQ